MRVLNFLTLCLSFALLANAGTERTSSSLRELKKNRASSAAFNEEQKRLEAEKLESPEEEESEGQPIGETIAAIVCYILCWGVICVLINRQRIFGDECSCCGGDCVINNKKRFRHGNAAMKARQRLKNPDYQGKCAWNRICCNNCCLPNAEVSDEEQVSDAENTERVADNKISPTEAYLALQQAKQEEAPVKENTD